MTKKTDSPIDTRTLRSWIVEASKTVDDLESVREATANRLQLLTRSEPDSDGIIRGRGQTPFHPLVMDAQDLLDSLKVIENQAILNMKHLIRKDPLFPLIKSSVGVGEKQAARLLGAIGDPYWHAKEDRPRTVSELWAYCGYSVVGGASQKRRKGSPVNWSTEARTRAYLIAESCVKTKGKDNARYRAIYDEAREKYEDAVHGSDCVRCGPSGKPALAGSPLSNGHQHARAMRIVSKELLKDLWLASKAAHEKADA